MKRLQISLLALAAVALMANDAMGQTGGKFLIEGRAGYQVQTGDINDYVKPGLVLGVSVGYGLGVKSSIWLGADWAALDGKDQTQGAQAFPNWKVGTLMGYFGYNLIAGMDEKPDLIGMIGVGASNWDVKEGNPNDPGFDSKTVFTIGALFKYTYWAGTKFAIVLNAPINFAFTDFKTSDGTELVNGTIYFPFSAGILFAL